MKNLNLTFLVVLLAFLIVSCVSIQDREISVQERANIQFVDQATVSFTSWQVFHIISSKRIKNKAYLELKKIAHEKHGANTDVVNIRITGSWSWWEMLNLWGNALGAFGLVSGINNAISAEDEGSRGFWFGLGSGLFVIFSGVVGNTQKITATGDIILYN